jgi:hypothetical protein
MPAEATHTARHPFAVFVLVLCVVSAGLAMAGTASGHPTEPPAVAAAVPEWARLAWYGLLAAGAAVALAGIARSAHRVTDLIAGLLWERCGVLGLGVGSVCYGMALTVLDGWVSKEAGVITLLFAAACGARVYGIGRDLGRIQTLLRSTR